MRNIWLLTVAGLYSVACATSAPKPAAVPVAASLPQSSAHLDGDAYRAALEDAYTHIVSRETSKPLVNAPVVDVEAAASIPIPDHRTIDGAVRYFSTGLKDSIQTSLIRAGRYRQIIEKALADEKLPKGLVYLPVIESAYIPTLTSRAGAHGIWQFMPDTAREYGLRVDWWVDERADPEHSTRAAAAFLKDLHRQFGDWSLALAAYNCGPGRVRRALKETGATTFWELLEQQAVPKETRGYVPTFFATLIIASDPQTYGFELGKTLQPDEKRVDVEGPLSLRYLAEVAGVAEEQLKELNPALVRGIVPPGRAQVRVPAKTADVILARARDLKNEDAYVKVCSFTLRKGDSISRLAHALGTKPETILAMNDLSESARLGSGDSILLPVRERELGALLKYSEDDDIFYAVRKGDTLYSVAKRHGLTVDELRDLNDLTTTAKLQPGQKLRVTTPRTLTAGGGM
ncbi:MAG TPA: transglycosylase SLT domain-containing protein [Thermoanaerobaculia bacterium]|jgi:membrane-bound lytic murein transglycosylase D